MILQLKCGDSQTYIDNVAKVNIGRDKNGFPTGAITYFRAGPRDPIPPAGEDIMLSDEAYLLNDTGKTLKQLGYKPVSTEK